MATPFPRDPSLLPAHQALVLSSADRAGMDSVVWEPDGFRENGVVRGWAGASSEGYWQVWSNGEEIDVGYAVFFTPEVSRDHRRELKQRYQGQPGTVEHSLLSGYLGETELGYTLTQDLARQWVEQMRTAEAGMESEAALAAAGFVLTDRSAPGNPGSSRQYKKDFGKGYFTLMVNGFGYKLIFLERRSSVHDNICRVRLAKQSYKGEAIPVVWPATVAVPAEVGLRVVLAAAAEYERLYTPGPPPGKRRP